MERERLMVYVCVPCVCAGCPRVMTLELSRQRWGAQVVQPMRSSWPSWSRRVQAFLFAAVSVRREGREGSLRERKEFLKRFCKLLSWGSLAMCFGGSRASSFLVLLGQVATERLELRHRAASQPLRHDVVVSSRAALSFRRLDKFRQAGRCVAQRPRHSAGKASRGAGRRAEGRQGCSRR